MISFKKLFYSKYRHIVVWKPAVIRFRKKNSQNNDGKHSQNLVETPYEYKYGRLIYNKADYRILCQLIKLKYKFNSYKQIKSRYEINGALGWYRHRCGTEKWWYLSITILQLSRPISKINLNCIHFTLP